MFPLRYKTSIALVYVFAVACSSSSGDGDGDAATAEMPQTQEQVVTPKSDSNGVVKATYDPSLAVTQTVQASSASGIKGAKVSLPPGALTVSADITIEQADTLVSDGTGRDLGLEDASKLTAVSSTVVVNASTSVDSATPFTLSIPLSSSSALTQAATTTGVLYKISKAASSGKTFVGVITGSDVTVSDSTLTVKTKYFGAYQAVTLAADIGTFAEAETFTPVVPIAQRFPYDGTWTSTCRKCSGESLCSDKETFIISGSSVVSSTTYYRDSACANEAGLVLTFATFALGGAVTEPAGALALDYIVSRQYETPTTEEAAAHNNASKRCGHTDWVVDKQIDLTYADCSASTSEKMGVWAYTNVTVDQDDTRMLVGKSKDDAIDDGSTTAKRQKAQETFYFTKATGS